jgi:hypothetical protein
LAQVSLAQGILVQVSVDQAKLPKKFSDDRCTGEAKASALAKAECVLAEAQARAKGVFTVVGFHGRHLLI